MHKRVAVIGAGPSGIAALKALLAEGHDAVAFEQGDRIGGNWVFRPGSSHSSVYETTHIISSKRWSAFEDFPMPEEYPDYPSHQQVLAYFEHYVAHFGLAPRIVLDTRVERASRGDDGGWTLQLAGAGTSRGECFDALLVANGHHWDPFLPEVDGRFDGEVLHSHAFKRAQPFRGLRVLVVGAGNSACDVAVEISRVAAHVGLSVRRGQHIVPKFLGGKPGDENNARLLWLPRRLRQWLLGRVLRLVQGRYGDYGLPEPEVGVLENAPDRELRTAVLHPSWADPPAARDPPLRWQRRGVRRRRTRGLRRGDIRDRLQHALSVPRSGAGAMGRRAQRAAVPQDDPRRCR